MSGLEETEHVFLSYARADGRGFGDRLQGRLLRYPIWRDVQDMPVGDDWWRVIEEKIRRARAVVLAVTPAAFRSEIVRREWTLARRLGKAVLPITEDRDIFRTAPRWLSRLDVAIVDAGHPDCERNWRRFEESLERPAPLRPVPVLPLMLPLPYVERAHALTRTLEALLGADLRNPTHATVVLHGPPGFGKSALAAAVTHNPAVHDAFSGGVLGVCLGPDGGQAVRGALSQIAKELGGKSVSFNSETEGAAVVAQLTEGRDCLLVIDDVWEPEHLRPFLDAKCARLVTTRDLASVPKDTQIKDTSFKFSHVNVSVDEMEAREALELLCAGLPAPPPLSLQSPLEHLARRLGQWPLLLGIYAHVLSLETSNTGLKLEQALGYVELGLEEAGLEAFDARQTDDRHRALAVSMEASLRRFDDGERQRLFELGVFRAEEAIPEAVVVRLWKSAGVAEFASRKLLRQARALVRLSDEGDGRGPVMSHHDAIQRYLEERLGPAELPRIHARLLRNYNPDVMPWAAVPDDGYLHARLAHHLDGADDTVALHGLIDPQWMQQRARATRAHQAFLTDAAVSVARAARSEPPDLVAIVRGSMAHVAVTGARPEARVLGLLTRLGRGYEASMYAALEPAAARRFEAFAHIADGYRFVRDSEGARHAWSNALEAIIDEARGSARERRIDRWARVLSTAEPPLPIVEAARQLQWCRSPRRICLQFSELLTQHGAFDAAARLLEEMADEPSAAVPLAVVAWGAARVGETPSAERWARRVIDLVGDRWWERSELALTLARAALALCAVSAGATATPALETARKEAADCSERNDRAFAAAHWATVAAHAGVTSLVEALANDALEISARVYKPGGADREHPLRAELAEAWARLGERARALEMLATIYPADCPLGPLVRVAASMPPDVVIEWMAETDRRYRGNWFRPLPRLCAALADASLVEIAEAVATWGDEAEQLQCRMAIALSAARQGRGDDRHALADQARQLASDVLLRSAGAKALAELAEIRALRGDRAGATRLAAEAVAALRPDPHFVHSSDEELALVADVLVRANLSEAAQAVVMMIPKGGPSEAPRDAASSEAAPALSRIGRLERANELAASIGDVATRAKTYARLAASQNAGEPAQEAAARALSAASQLGRKHGDDLLDDVRRTLSQAGLGRQALAAANAMTDPVRRARALHEILLDAELFALDAEAKAEVEAARGEVQSFMPTVLNHWDLAVRAIGAAQLWDCFGESEPHLERALRDVRSLPAHECAKILARVAACRGKYHEPSASLAREAVATILAEQDVVKRWEAMAEVLSPLIEAGFDEALPTLDQEFEGKDRVAIAAARLFAERRRWQDAWEVAQKARGVLNLSRVPAEDAVRCVLGPYQAAKGHADNAMATLAAIDSAGHRVQAAAESAAAFARAGDRPNALRVLELAVTAFRPSDSPGEEDLPRARDFAGQMLQLDAYPKIWLGRLGVPPAWATLLWSSLGEALSRRDSLGEARSAHVHALILARDLGPATLWRAIGSASASLVGLDGGQTSERLLDVARNAESWMSQAVTSVTSGSR